MTSLRLLAVGGALFALFLSGSAIAQEGQSSNEAESRLLFQKGLAHYHLREYDQAIEALKEGYRLSPAPGFLFNIAQAYRMKGDCQEARRFYQEDAQLEPEAVYHTEVLEHIREMTRCIDERSAYEQLLEKTPGTPGRGKKIAGIVAASVGVVAMGVGTYFALDARSKANEIETLTMSGGVWNPDLHAEGASSADKALVLFSVGGAALLTGSVLYYFGWRDARDIPSVSAGITSRSFDVSWHCAF